MIIFLEILIPTIKVLQWHSYEVQNLDNIDNITLLASSKTTQISNL